MPRCVYCKSDVSMADENEHTKGHVIALARTGRYTMKEVAAAVGVTHGRASAYLYNAGLRLKLFRQRRLIACGETAAEVEAEGRLYARHGFAPASDILPAAGGGRFLYQIWEKGGDKDGTPD